jgi:hypothetical protein
MTHLPVEDGRLRPEPDAEADGDTGHGGHVRPRPAVDQISDGLPVDPGLLRDPAQAQSTLRYGVGEGTGDVLHGGGPGVGELGMGPGFRIIGKLARRPLAVHASDHEDALLSVKIGFNPFTGCLSSRWAWSVTLSSEISGRIRDYCPRLPRQRWARVADQVRATVAAAAPATCYEARRLLYAVGRLAVWADQQGLPQDPGVWLRTETIDAFVLSGCTGLDGSTVQTCRSWLRRTQEARVWVQRGEAPPVRISCPRKPRPPYEKGELARLRDWSGHLPGQARRDGLALIALGAGCGLTPGEIVKVRGRHIDATCGVPVLDETLLGRLVACRADWTPVLTELAETAGAGYVFRPGRKVEVAKNLVSSWPSRHRPPDGASPAVPVQQPDDLLTRQ